jgi:hypothetical protein
LSSHITNGYKTKYDNSKRPYAEKGNLTFSSSIIRQKDLKMFHDLESLLPLWLTGFIPAWLSGRVMY